MPHFNRQEFDEPRRRGVGTDRSLQGSRRMAGKVKGPAIFLAQFAGDSPPFNSFDAICGWAASLGYKGVQIPTWDGRLFDLTKAAASQDLLRRAEGNGSGARARNHRTLDASAGPARRGQSSLRRRVRRLRAERDARAPGRAAGLGGRAIDDGRQRLASSRPRRACDVLRRAGLAVRLSLAAARRRA